MSIIVVLTAQVVSVEELDALHDAFWRAMRLDPSWLPHKITGKFVDNILSGAKPRMQQGGREAGSDPPPSISSASTADPKRPALDGTSVAAAAADSAVKPGEGTEKGRPQGDAGGGAAVNPTQCAYQRLAALFLIQLMHNLLTMPAADGLSLLADYNVDYQFDAAEGAASGPSAQASGGQAAALHTTPVGALASIHDTEAAAAALHPISSAQPESLTCNVSVEADVMDDDATAYEDMDISSAHSTTPADAPLTQGNDLRAVDGGISNAESAVAAAIAAADAASADPNADLLSMMANSASAADSNSLSFTAMLEAVTAAASTSNGGSNALNDGLSQQNGRNAAWHELRPRLLQLAGHVSYDALKSETVWQSDSALATVLQVIQAACCHAQADDLEVVSYAYTALAVERLSACGAELVDQLWAALGLDDATQSVIAKLDESKEGFESSQGNGSGSGGASAPQPAEFSRDAGCASSSNHPAVPRAARMAFSAAAALAQRVSAASSKARLWLSMQDHVLPAAAPCLQLLSQRAGCSPEDIGDLSLILQVLEFYILSVPRGKRAGGSLVFQGLVHPLAQLLSKPVLPPGFEALPLALLLACASHASVADAVSRMPDVAAVLLQPRYAAAGGVLEAIGQVWPIVVSFTPEAIHAATSKSSASNGPHSNGEVSTSIVNGSSSGSMQEHVGAASLPACLTCKGFLNILENSEPDIAYLSHLQRLLVLLTDLQQASSHQLALPAAVATALQRLAPQIRKMGAGDAVCGTPGNDGGDGSRAVHSANGSGADDSGRQLHEQRKSGCQGDDSKNVLHAQALEQRRTRQLQTACLKLLKQVLSNGGKQD